MLDVDNRHQCRYGAWLLPHIIKTRETSRRKVGVRAISHAVSFIGFLSCEPRPCAFARAGTCLGR